MGKPEKQMQASEKACYDKLGKTLVLSRTVSKGHALQLGDLTIKVAEPKGIDGLEVARVIGRVVKRDLDEDDSLCYSCLED